MLCENCNLKLLKTCKVEYKYINLYKFNKIKQSKKCN